MTRVGGIGFDVDVIAQRTERTVEKLDDAEAFVDGIEQGAVALLAERERLPADAAFGVDGGPEAGVLLFQCLRVTSKVVSVFDHDGVP